MQPLLLQKATVSLLTKLRSVAATFDCERNSSGEFLFDSQLERDRLLPALER
jgi:hypothetical protein